ncbi:aminopeptidase P family protein [Gemmatimonas groenlandica]|uniref:Xaa-Pro aminopeptidase n=1 Tax=Gemmatimonas groenlandica TaxID=2732249 RepID=A0A6M4INE5_9BACT|nr:aminopeptidase P family protein [Gemmatimonas groenlandica]QJR36240.1 M24 family metallopeptidase [Gemmatimonas groenlandica]
MSRLLPWSLVLALAPFVTAAGQRPLGAPPAVARAEYAARREALASALVGDGVILALGGREPREDYVSFFQATNFYYLTGMREPDAALVGVKQGATVEWTVFVQPKEPSREVWTGNRVGPENAEATWGVRGRSMAELDAAVDSLMRSAPAPVLSVVADLGFANRLTLDDQYIAAVKSRMPTLTVRNISREVGKLRAYKSDAELALIKRATAITVGAHADAAKAVKPDGFEYEVQADLERALRRQGAERPSFSSIVGSGPNGTTLHYNANDRQMKRGEMVVVDIGASFDGYAADMTRSYPVGGQFTPEQRAVYQVVRDAQAAAERQARGGRRAGSMSDSSNAVLAAGLARLGLIESADATYDCSADGKSQCKQYRLFYMHGLGHGIGLEVHDPDRYEVDGTLQPGSVFTIEPGIYVRENVVDVLPKTERNGALAAKLAAAVRKYRNIGVRIEDDYLIARDGSLEWLTKSPREIQEIEAVMRAVRVF